MISERTPSELREMSKILLEQKSNNRRTKQKGILLLVKYGHLQPKCTSDCLLLNWIGKGQAKNVLEWLRYFRKLWDRWSRWKAAPKPWGTREKWNKAARKRRELGVFEQSIIFWTKREESVKNRIEAVRKQWEINKLMEKMAFWYIAKERCIAWTNLFIWKMMKRYVIAYR